MTAAELAEKLTDEAFGVLFDDASECVFDPSPGDYDWAHDTLETALKHTIQAWACERSQQGLEQPFGEEAAGWAECLRPFLVEALPAWEGT